MGNICIIPARGGSKRIPKKNIKDFLGKPIIAYSIELAFKCGLFDEVMVSTDDIEIADIAKQYGASVPFMRSKKNSDDITGTGDAVFEVLKLFENEGSKFDICCCLYATSPLTQTSTLKEAMNLLISKDFDVTFPVSKFNSPILRSYEVINNTANFKWPEYEKERSQDLLESFYDTGQFYLFYPTKFNSLSNKNTFGHNKGVIVIEEHESQDIDNEVDWKLAELKYKLLKQNNTF